MGSSVSKLEEKVKIGSIILKEFFEMSDKEIKAKLESIIGTELPNSNDIFESHTDVERVIRNEEPLTITLLSWDSVEIDCLGILFAPEHGLKVRIKHFDKHFKL